MTHQEVDFEPAELTELERKLIWRHQNIAGDWQYKQELKIRILVTAHDYHIWSQINPHRGLSDAEMFFNEFRYEKDELGECDIVYRGVRALLDSLEKIKL